MQGEGAKMEKDLRGKVIVITGASSGFGKGAALKFAKAGANVVLAARRDNLLDELANECAAAGSSALAVPTDVSDPTAMEKLAQSAMAEFSKVDVWINNAGGAAIGVFEDVPIHEHVKVIETDLIGTIYGSYLALQIFKREGRGILINVASMIGKVPAPYYASYSAAKHGVVGLSAALRQELKAEKFDDIHVCTVMPMAMDTPFFEHAANYTGKEAVAIPPLDDADKVVDTLVELAQKPKSEVPVGNTSLTNLIMHNIVPAASEAMMGAITHQKQIVDAAPAPVKPGGLSRADSTGTEVKDPTIRQK
jgi:short-subunit dehydrogenase